MDQPDSNAQTPATDEAPAEAIAPAESTDAAPSPPPRRRSWWFPVAVLAGAVTAAAGFAGGVLLVQRYPEILGLTGGAGVDQRLSDLGKRLDDLAARQAQLAGQPGSAAAIEALRSQQTTALADLTAGQEALSHDLQSLSERIAKVESLPVAATGETAVQIATQTARAEENARAAQTAAQKLKDAADATLHRAAVDTAMASLTAALDSGAALGPGLAQLTKAGVAVPEALAAQAQGVPTLAALRAAFPDAARDALAQSLAATAGTGLWARTVAFLRSQSGERSLTPRAGTDPDAVLSRAEAALKMDDLAAALDEIAALPPAGQARMAEWAGLARRRLEAKAAIAALSATSN
ncbi:MAG: hypothetical protein JSR87_03510 [Proteobacteria bacterium]|nr:hypothetical protein [Pseudomonadota bacterium]MBS0573295.1 hypothetical protein [Pseudomonadota bacterium]